MTKVSSVASVVPASFPQRVEENPSPFPAPERRYNVPRRGGLIRPETSRPTRVLWGYVITMAVVHVLALLAVLPWFFTWTGLMLCIAGHYVFGMLGMTLGYHRLLTHRGFDCPKWLEHAFALLGVCCLQDTPARWVAIHRRHHQRSDELPDPHSPLVTFFWSHFGWLIVENRELSRLSFYERYARDVLHDPLYLALERRKMSVWVYVVHALMFFIVGLSIGVTTSGSYGNGFQLAASILVWGVFVRTVLVWHVTWAVNSVTHLWGYRNYETSDNSRNNWLVGLLAHGEGWHNNHHADQRSAAHGHNGWELDITYLTIVCLERLGLARNVVRPAVWRQNEAPPRRAQGSQHARHAVHHW